MDFRQFEDKNASDLAVSNQFLESELRKSFLINGALLFEKKR